jgi:hypothetical protein
MYEQDRRYAWGTVAMFAGFMAIVAIAAAVTVWVTHRPVDTMPVSAPAAAPASTVPAASGPDDSVVPTPVAAPPPAAVVPPSPTTTVTVTAPPPAAVAPTQDADDDQYVAVAISPVTRWSGYGTAGTIERARTIALNECKIHGGNESLCSVAESAHYGCVAVAIDASGSFKGAKGPDPDSARQAALASLPGANGVAGPVCSK